MVFIREIFYTEWWITTRWHGEQEITKNFFLHIFTNQIKIRFHFICTLIFSTILKSIEKFSKVDLRDFPACCFGIRIIIKWVSLKRVFNKHQVTWEMEPVTNNLFWHWRQFGENIKQNKNLSHVCIFVKRKFCISDCLAISFMKKAFLSKGQIYLVDIFFVSVMTVRNR